MVTGLAASGLVLGAVSVVSDLADMAALREAAPEAGGVELPPGSGFDAVREDRETALPSVAEGPVQGTAPRVAPPGRDDLARLSGADTAPVAMPDTGAAGTLGAPPLEAQGEAGIVPGGDSPVLPAPLVIATDPAQPAAPDMGEAGAGLAAPGPEAGEGARVEAPAPAPEVQSAITAPAVPASEAGAGIAQAAPDIPEVAALEPQGSEPQDAGARQAEGVTVGRLPQIGATPEATPEMDAPGMDEPAALVPDEPQGALERNAEPFEVPEDKPLMAIVLLDEGQGALGLEALQAFPYPLSFAIPASRADAEEAAARYRAAGFEVLIAVDLPGNATAADTETAMQTWLDAIPQAVAVMEGTGTGLQQSREASAQLAPILRESGHGIVMLPNGLNTAQKLIARDGVPSVTLFRDFDAQGQNAAAVRRFLDQGAMRAGQQEEGVIMLGRVRPDTISALLLWGLQDRASSVALAPVSAVLRSGRSR
jgi:polysaccharide deacetylase 2 family uncharacterized protein YibQ